MIKQAKKDGKLIQGILTFLIFFRDYNGKYVMIDYYILKHSQGVLFYYENNSPRYQLKEKISFELWNCRIEGIVGNDVSFVLNPQEKYFINIVKDENEEEFNLNIKEMSYEVESETEITSRV